MKHQNMIHSTLLSLTIFAGSTSMLTAKEKSPIRGPDLSKQNFGVVVNNDQYKIYRSDQLGKAGLEDVQEYLEEQGLPAPKTVIYMNHYGYGFPFYFALEEYDAAASQGFTFHHSFGPTRTYVDGENPYFPTDDIDRGNHLGSRAKKLFPTLNNGVDGGVSDFVRILKMVLDPQNQPVLFHCMGGYHRTGMMAMALRYMQDGYWVKGPKKKVHGIPLTPAQVEYSLYNSLMFRENNIEFIERFKQDPRFLLLKQEYGDALQDDYTTELNDQL